MQISFTDKSLAETCSDASELLSAFGKNRGKKIVRRLDDLQAVPTLEAMRNLPGRCHELKHERANTLALYLDGMYRLIIKPDHDPLPVKDDGGLDWNQVTQVCVVSIEDYHD